MIDMIVETDIGHDPDDFFSLCYLAGTGQVNIRAILICPGDLDQIALARLLNDKLELNARIGVSKKSEKVSSGGMHHEILHRHHYSLEGVADGDGAAIFGEVFSAETQVFIIGPATSTGKYLCEHPDTKISKLTMQGGFLPCRNNPFFSRELPFFDNQFSMPSFNPNGDRRGFHAVCDAKVGTRQFVGKNVCHGILYNEGFHRRVEPKNKAQELFKEAGDIYFQKHREKKFHDPTAAVCHLHPEIGKWVRGRPVQYRDGWTTLIQEDADFILGNVDREQLWNCLLGFK